MNSTIDAAIPVNLIGLVFLIKAQASRAYGNHSIISALLNNTAGEWLPFEEINLVLQMKERCLEAQELGRFVLHLLYSFG